jgi:hypothetical protein
MSDNHHDKQLAESRQLFNDQPSINNAFRLASALYDAADHLRSRGHVIKALCFIWQAFRLCRKWQPVDIRTLTADQLEIWSTIERGWARVPLIARRKQSLKLALGLINTALFRQPLPGTELLLRMGACEVFILQGGPGHHGVDHFYQRAAELATQITDAEKLVRFHRFALRVCAERGLTGKAAVHRDQALAIAKEKGWGDQLLKINQDARDHGLYVDET